LVPSGGSSNLVPSVGTGNWSFFPNFGPLEDGLPELLSFFNLVFTVIPTLALKGLGFKLGLTGRLNLKVHNVNSLQFQFSTLDLLSKGKQGFSLKLGGFHGPFWVFPTANLLNSGWIKPFLEFGRAI